MIPDSRTARVLGYLLVGGICAFLVAPILLALPTAFTAGELLVFPPRGFSLRWFERFLTSPRWMDALRHSVIAALLTVSIAVPIGVLASYALVRSKSRFKAWFYSFFLTPIIVPQIVIALGLYYALAPFGLLGRIWVVSLGHVVLALPLVIITVSANLRNAYVNIERAAQTLGAHPVRVFTTIVLPLIRPGILVAALFAFLTSFDDLLVALFLAGVRSATLPKRMWESARFEVDPTLSAVSVLLIIVATTLLVVANWLRRERKT